MPVLSRPTFTIEITHGLLHVNTGVCCHVSVSCRCSKEDETVPSTSTATGPATRKDSATSKANSGSVGQ